MSRIYTTLWRSSLARSSLLRRPHLGHAIGRHGCGGSHVLLGGGANAAVPRGYYSDYDWSSWSCDEFGIDDPEPAKVEASPRHPSSYGHPNQAAPPPQRRRHLYIAVDDWNKGFSLHKLDLSDDSDPGSHRRLPPPAMRLEFSSIDRYAPLVAVGTNKIVALSTRKDGLAVIYNTDTGGQAITHCSPNVLHREWCQAAMGAAGNTLYAFVCSLFHHGTGELHFLELEGASDDLDNNGDDDDSKQLSWSTSPSLLPFKLETAYGRVCPYAVHPGGKTISVSVSGDSNRPVGTYSYNTETHEWTHQGTWILPFAWQAYYDDELDAWVGPDGYYGMAKIGCCDIPAHRTGGSVPAPVWKLCEDRLISGLPLLSTKLVSMGGGWFCFVEIGPREGIDIRCCIGDGDKCELRVITFRARYGKNGELRTTDRRLVRSYVLSRYDKLGFAVKAFWM